jgi:hypothetical protein
MATSAPQFSLFRVRALAALAASGLLLFVAGCKTTSSEPFVAIGSCDASRPAAGIQRLEVDDPIGTVDVAPSTDDTVTVTAKIAVRESLLPQFPAADAARDLAIDRVGDSLRIGSGHRDDGHRDHFQIDLVIRAPARFAWKVQAGVGSVTVTGGGNAVEAACGVGDVTLRGAIGAARATTGVGDVAVGVDSLASGVVHSGTGNVRVAIAGGALAQSLECSSGVGNVEVAVAKSLSADVQLKAGTGNVHCDGARLVVTSHVVGGTAEGKLGAGGPRLTATAGTGNVSLRVRE